MPRRGRGLRRGRAVHRHRRPDHVRPNGFAAATTSCNVDNDVCTVDECNGSGACVFDSNARLRRRQRLQPGHLRSDRRLRQHRNAVDDLRGGDQVDPQDQEQDEPRQRRREVPLEGRPGAGRATWAIPTQSTRYELCIYDNTRRPDGDGRAARRRLDSGRSDQFADRLQVQGLDAPATTASSIIKLKGSNLDKARAKLTAKGDNLPDTADAAVPVPGHRPALRQRRHVLGQPSSARRRRGPTTCRTSRPRHRKLPTATTRTKAPWQQGAFVLSGLPTPRRSGGPRGRLPPPLARTPPCRTRQRRRLVPGVRSRGALDRQVDPG